MKNPFIITGKILEPYFCDRREETAKVLGSAFIKRHSLQSASLVQAALKKLLSLDFITMEEGYYTLPDRFMLLYIKQKQQPSVRLV